MKNFKRAYEKLRLAKSVVHQMMREAFPLESTVYYFHGNHERQGIVREHGYDDHLLIVSPSEKKIWLDAYRIGRVIKL